MRGHERGYQGWGGGRGGGHESGPLVEETVEMFDVAQLSNFALEAIYIYIRCYYVDIGVKVPNIGSINHY
jgi:hypothetical protein